MRFVNRAKSDAGSAIVEFVTVGVSSLLLVSVLVTGAFVVQRAAFTAQAAAREATRAFVTSNSEPAAFASAHIAANLTFADARLSPPAMRISCSDVPCLKPNARVTVSVSIPVDLVVARFTIRAHHEEPVSPWF